MIQNKALRNKQKHSRRSIGRIRRARPNRLLLVPPHLLIRVIHSFQIGQSE